MIYDTDRMLETTSQRTKPYEIVWHGRGGQGAVTAAKIVAQAAYLKGYQGVTATPSFGAERRGVPVSASTRISPETIRVISQVEKPDAVVVLDQTVLNREITAGLERGGWLIVNTRQDPKELGVRDDINIASVDATGVCQELGLVVAGLTVVNTAMLGAFIRATGMIDMATIEKVIRTRFNKNVVAVNLAVIKQTYAITRLERIE